MVCKEDVLSWFKEATTYRRVDLMCQLLNMCLPFELRYLGSCVEEQGKHDYQELRGPALVSNNPEKLAKDICISKGVFDKCARARLIVLISVLHSRNYNCANLIYNALLRTEGLENYLNNYNFNKDKDLHHELLLLFLMANNHPAFTFEQKRYFADTYTRLSETEAPVQPTHTLPPYPPGLGYNIKPPLPVHPMTISIAKGPSSALSYAEAPMPPPGIPLPAVHSEFVAPQGMWTRTPFPPPPPPDLTVFPPPISPLVSQQSSPTPSRSVSPTRMYSCRPHPPPMPPIHIERLAAPPLPMKDSCVIASPHYNTDLKTVPIEEVLGEAGDKNPQSQWLEPPMVIGTKLPNGLLASMSIPAAKCPGMFLGNEVATLSLEAEPSLHCTSSSSSSSDCHSPPATPTDTSVPPHGPGRGEPHTHTTVGAKARSSTTNNSAPPPGLAAVPTAEMSSASTLYTSTCTVPYTTHYPPPPTTTFHNRSLFYTQTYRPQFPAYQQNGEIPYMFPYVPMMNFSAPPPPKVTCYNCGLAGHVGSECKEPTIEEITQKKGYQIDYTSPPPDSQPPAEKQ